MASITQTDWKADSATISARPCDAKVRHELERARDEVLRVRSTTIVTAAVAALAVSLLVLAYIDFAYELSWNARAGALGTLLGAACAVGGWTWHVWRRFTLAETASMVEGRDDGLGQRLRTALDYDQGRPAPAPAAPRLLEALERETASVVERIDWTRIVDRRTARWGIAAAVAGCVAVFGSLGAGPEWRTALARTLLVPREYTTVTVTPLEATLRAGESLTVEVEVKGRPVRDAVLRYRSVSTEGNASGEAEWKELPLLPPDVDLDERPELLEGPLSARLPDLQAETIFEVLAGPRDLPDGHVKVLQQLELRTLQADITPPEYTRLPAETVNAREIRVREGSQVALRLEFNRAASVVKLTPRAETAKASADDDEAPAQEARIPLEPVSGASGSAFVGTLPDVRQNQTLELTANASDGMQLSPVQVSIRVILDQKPKLQFVEPPEQLEVLPTTEVPLRVEAKDDLALLKVGILAQFGDKPAEVLAERAVEGTTDPVQVLTTLLLEERPLSFQDGVTYHAFAEDNYFGSPRRVTTPLRFIDIRPYQREFQKADGGACESCNSTTLEELIARQRKNLSQTFVQQERPDDRTQRERLTTNQREIEDATSELATGLAERGVFLPELSEAAQAMQQAIASLEQGQLEEATLQEQTALTQLIRARQNFRQKVSQSSSQSQSECKKFDQQQRQKLRTPEQKKEDQKEEVAKARKELEKLAEQQRQWSEQVRSTCQNPSQSQSQSKSQSQSQSKSQSQSQSQSQAKSESESQSQSDSEKQAQSESKPENSAEKPGESPSREQLAEAQRKMMEQLAALREQMERAGANSEAGKEQAKQASESMKAGLDQLGRDQGEKAAREGERSAEQLEQLAEHLAALQSSDLPGRLDGARQMAEQLARRQSELAKQAGAKSESPNGTAAGDPKESNAEEADRGGSKGEKTKSGTGKQDGSKQEDLSPKSLAGATPDEREAWARAERDLAQQADLLAERLAALRADSAGEKSGLGERLSEVYEQQSPSQIGGGMRRTAEDAQAGRSESARQGAEQAQRDTQRLAKALGGLRKELSQPELQELMKLEEQLAALQRQVDRQRQQGEAGTLGDRWQEIAPRLESLAEGDRRVAEAIQRMAEKASDSSSSPSGSKPESRPGENRRPGGNARPGEHREVWEGRMPEGYHHWSELPEFARLNEVSKAVQMKIQEEILAGALQDSDEPVPPEYRSLVDEYYRALSDDLSP